MLDLQVRIKICRAGRRLAAGLPGICRCRAAGGSTAVLLHDVGDTRHVKGQGISVDLKGPFGGPVGNQGARLPGDIHLLVEQEEIRLAVFLQLEIGVAHAGGHEQVVAYLLPVRLILVDHILTEIAAASRTGLHFPGFLRLCCGGFRRSGLGRSRFCCPGLSSGAFSLCCTEGFIDTVDFTEQRRQRIVFAGCLDLLRSLRFTSRLCEDQGLTFHVQGHDAVDHSSLQNVIALARVLLIRDGDRIPVHAPEHFCRFVLRCEGTLSSFLHFHTEGIPEGFNVASAQNGSQLLRCHAHHSFHPVKAEIRVRDLLQNFGGAVRFRSAVRFFAAAAGEAERQYKKRTNDDCPESFHTFLLSLYSTVLSFLPRKSPRRRAGMLSYFTMIPY